MYQDDSQANRTAGVGPSARPLGLIRSRWNRIRPCASSARGTVMRNSSAERTEGRAVNDLKNEMKERDKEIAHNEEQRHVVSAVRVSSWAILIAVVVCAVIARVLGVLFLTRNPVARPTVCGGPFLYE